eukprot:m51a1_g1831 putative mannose-6-phosphate isomerase (403) ;mRNA; f:536226-537936
MQGSTLIELAPHVQRYEWGTRGPAGLVARLSGSPAAPSEPFAELWLGTHPSGPTLATARSSLGAAAAGAAPVPLCEALGAQLPYLLKVLSVARSLSIQAHPDKQLAARLHAARPDVYRDDNHKPEMAIALTRFEMMCGFRPVEEIARLAREVPEFASVLGSDCPAPDSGATGLRRAFTALMQAPRESIASALGKLVARVQAAGEAASDAEKLAVRLAAEYPGDVGVFCAFFLNHLFLSPGESVYLGADEPHAYLRGDCVECMACSDNVVRAGLTPKVIDVETLVSMLTYKAGKPELLKPTTTTLGSGVVLREFFPPVSEFCVAELRVPAGATCELPWSEMPRIAVVLEGAGVVALKNKEFSLPTRTGLAHFVQGRASYTASSSDSTLYIASPNFRNTNAASK